MKDNNTTRKGTTMTRKQAIQSLWCDLSELMSYRLGDDNELRLNDLEKLWALCFTSDKRKKFYRGKTQEVLQHVKYARECGKALWQSTGDPKALKTLMEEIEAFAVENDITVSHTLPLITDH